MKTWILITAVLVSSLLGIPSTTRARSPERPKVAQPACTITGTARNDVLRGTNGADVICGLGGNDVIHGFGGDDTLIGGVGNDTLHGGAGNDSLRGDTGNDTLVGNGGDDSLVGGNGNDRLDGQVGHDTIVGEAGTDTLVGGDGDDALTGGAGRDQVRPGSGDNYCAPDNGDALVGRCRVDRNPPVFTPMALSQSVTAGETLVLEWRIEEASAIDMSWVFIGGPNGWVDWCGFPVMGIRQRDDASDTATYRTECNVPANAVNGTYTLEYNAVDVFGNYAQPQRVMLTIGGGSDDAEAPIAQRIDLSQSTLSAGDAFKLTTLLQDASGVVGARVYVQYRMGWIVDSTGAFYVSYDGDSLTATSDTTATLEQQLTFRSDAPVGEYVIWLSVIDAVGNRNFFDTGTTITLR